MGISPYDSNITSPLEINQAGPAFNPANPQPTLIDGYLYKRFGDNNLYWYPNGGPEVSLTGGTTFNAAVFR